MGLLPFLRIQWGQPLGTQSSTFFETQREMDIFKVGVEGERPNAGDTYLGQSIINLLSGMYHLLSV